MSVIGLGAQPTLTAASGVWSLKEFYNGTRRGAWPGLSLSYEKAVLLDNPVSYWRLGESSGAVSVDIAGDNDISWTNVPSQGISGAISGDGDTSVTFNGTSHYGVVSDHASLDPATAMSMECWLYVAEGDDVATQKYLFLKSYTSHDPPYYQYGIRVAGTGTTGSIDIGGQIGGGGSVSVGHARDQWHHVVVTRDASFRRLYVDGELKVEVAVSGVMSTYGMPLYFGAYGNLSKTSTYLYDGRLDEVAIYDHALTSDQARRHFYRGLGYTGYALEVLASGPISYWKMDDLSGTTITDAKGVHDGTLSGPTVGIGGTPGVLGGTYISFDGISDVADISSIDLSGASNVTVECWTRMDSVSAGHHRVFSQEAVLYVGRSGNTLTVYEGSGAGWSNTFYSSDITSYVGEWVHLVYVKSGTTYKAYIDGVEVLSGTGDAVLGTAAATTRIGDSHNAVSDQAWDGDFTDYAIYTKALTQAEIQKHYDAVF